MAARRVEELEMLERRAARAWAMRNDGMSWPEIAEEMGLTAREVYYAANRDRERSRVMKRRAEVGR